MKNKTLNILRLLLVITLCVCSLNVLAQRRTKPKEGKLRIFLLEYRNFSMQEDSCMLYILSKETIVAELNLSELIKHSLEEELIEDLYFGEGKYTMLIENLAKVPVLFVNIEIRKGLMHFVRIDFKKLWNMNSSRDVIIFDYHDDLQRKLKESGLLPNN